MQRVMIVGGPGSGKSTLAVQLGAQFDLPVFHMDRFHWKENWVERPFAEKKQMVDAVEAQDHWVLEGGISATYANRIQRADLMIWRDLPVGLRLWRVTKRLFRHLGQARPDLPAGCVERLHPETLAFYWFIWTSRHTSRAKIQQAAQTYGADTRIVHVTHPRELTAFLSALG